MLDFLKSFGCSVDDDHEVIVLDPLFLKLLDRAGRGRLPSLPELRASYGEDPDIDNLAAAISQAVSANPTSLVVADLWTVLTLGGTRRLQPLADAFQGTPFALFVPDSKAILDELQRSGLSQDVPIATWDMRGYAVDQHSFENARDGKGRKWEPTLSEWLGASVNYLRLHRDWLHRCLTRHLMQSGAVIKPAEGEFIMTRSGMLINAFVDVKGLCQDPDYPLFIAYEMARALSFELAAQVAQLRPQPEIDGLVVANNTSVIFGVLTQHLLGLSLVIVDHAGPVPSLQTIIADIPRERFDNMRFCLIQDVNVTGREADLTREFVQLKGGTLDTRLAVYDLAGGTPMMFSPHARWALCYPGPYLDYLRRSRTWRLGNTEEARHATRGDQ